MIIGEIASSRGRCQLFSSWWILAVRTL